MSITLAKYQILLQDGVSSIMNKLGIQTDSVASKFTAAQNKVAQFYNAGQKLGDSLSTLRDKLDDLRTTRDMIDSKDIESIRAYNSEIKRLQSNISYLETINGAKWKSGLNAAVGQIPGIGFASNPYVVGAAGMAMAGSEAMQFEKTMAQVNVTAQLQGKQLEALSAKLKVVGNQYGKSYDDVGGTYLKALNATNDVDESIRITNMAAKAASTGMVNMQDMGLALAMTMNNVKSSGATASDVLNVLLVSQQQGNAELSDMAQHLPRVIAAVGGLRMKFKEAAGAYTFFTKHADPSTAETYMTNLATMLSRKDIKDNLMQVGVNIYDSTGKLRDMVGVTSDFVRVMSTMKDVEQNDFLDKMGIKDAQGKTALTTMINNLGELKLIMGGVNENGGALAKMLTASQSTINDANKAWNSIKNNLADLGQAVLPLINSGLQAVNWLFSGTIAATTVLFGLLAGLSVAFVASKFGAWGLVAGLTGVNFELSAMNILLDALGIGLVIAGIALLVKAIMYAWQKFEWFRGGLMGLKNAFVEIFKALIQPISDFIQAFKDMRDGNWGAAAKSLGHGLIGLTPVGMGMNIYSAKDKISGAFQKGYADGAAQVKANKLEEAQSKVLGDTAPAKMAPVIPNTGFNTGGQSSSDTSVISTGIDDVNKGGNKVRNVYVTIQKFQDSINIHTTTLKEGMGDVRRIINEEIVRAASGAEQMLGAQ